MKSEWWGQPKVMTRYNPQVGDVDAVVSSRVRVNKRVNECTGCSHALPPTMQRPGRPYWEVDSKTGTKDQGAFVVLVDGMHQMLHAAIGTTRDFGVVQVTVCGKGLGDEAMRACRPNLLASMEAMNVGYCLVVGRGAMKAVRPDLEWEQVLRSTPWFVWKDRWLCKAIDGVEDVLVGRVSKKLWVQEIEQFVNGVELGVGVEVIGSGGCVRCGDHRIALLDENGIGWCAGHQHVGMNGAKEVDRYWKPQQKVEQQMGLWDER